VEDPPRVRGRQPRGDVHRHLERAPNGQPAAVEPALQRLAFHELEDHVRQVALAADVVNGDDGRVVDGPRRPRLLLEEPQPLRVPCRLEVEDLHGDLAAEAPVTGPKDLRHAAHTEGREELVGAEPLSRPGPRFRLRLRRQLVQASAPRRGRSIDTP
jgi:hypothetical protein